MDNGNAGIRAKAGLPFVIGIGVGLCAWIALPFLPVIVWSATFAILSDPMQRRISTLLRSPSIAAAVTSLVVAVILVVPAIFVIGTLLNEAVESSATVFSTVDAGIWAQISATHPKLAPVIAQVTAWVDPTTIIRMAQSWLAEWSATFVQGSIAGTIIVFVTFYFLFFMLKDRVLALEGLRRLLPLTDPEFDRLARRIADAVKATVYGTATVAALQGGLGGLMFWLLDLPAPIFWGVIMGLLAIVPFLGAFVVWAPAAAVLAASGDYASAIILVVWGVIVVGLVDNFVYPILVGARLLLHPLLAFVALFGGLLLFGTYGIILGPVAVAALQTLLDINRARSKAVPA